MRIIDERNALLGLDPAPRKDGDIEAYLGHFVKDGFYQVEVVTLNLGNAKVQRHQATGAEGGES